MFSLAKNTKILRTNCVKLQRISSESEDTKPRIKDTFSLKMNHGARISSVKMSPTTSRRKTSAYTHIYITD